MKPLLIDENRKQADQTIQAETAKAKKLTALIAEYNKQENLENLTAQTAFEFLKNPKGYLEQHIILESGLSVKNPRAEKVAELMGIDYARILSLYVTANFSRFGIDENLQVFLTSDAESEIRENSKFYLKEESEIKAYQRLQKLCDDLNAHCELFRVDLFDRNGIAPRLKLETKKEADTYIFVPNIQTMKEYLKG